MSFDAEMADISQSSQGTTGKEVSLSKEEFNRKVAEIVRYILFADRRNAPVRRADLTKNAMKNINPKLYSRLLEAAFKDIEKLFGYIVKELEVGKAKMYILVNKLDLPDNTQLQLFGPAERRKMGLIMIVLSFIFMSEGVVTQDQLWSFLKHLGIEQGKRHAELGDVEKQINQEFTKQMYLDKKKVTGREGVSFEYRWGVRAKAEISYRNVLGFVSEIYGVNIESWKNHYKLVIESESQTAAETQ